MPNSAMRPCSYPGCPALVQHGRCEQHAEAPRPVYNRDPERQRLYDRKWQMRRRLQLSKYPWCADCLAQGRYTAATDVHHINPHRGDPTIFITSPLISLCHSCHSKVTNGEPGRGGENVSNPSLFSGHGRPHEKNSQCEESC